MTTKIADDTQSIAQRLKEIEAENTARINGISLEDAKPTEPPADIDWTGMYGYQAVGQTYSGWVWDQSKLGWVKYNGKTIGG